MIMKNIVRTFSTLVALLVAACPGFGQAKIATTAAQFLGISVSPRAIGMGGAYVASNSDAASLYWNPGAFAQAGKTQFVFSNTDWLAGTKFRWFGAIVDLDGENAFGVSFTQLDYGEEEVTTEASPEGTGQTWAASDLAIGVSYSRRLTDRFSMGGTIKYVNQSIWNSSANAFTFDLGLLFVTSFNEMRLGVSMSNFGGDLKLDGRDLLRPLAGTTSTVGNLKTEAWPMPLLFRVGVAMDVVRSDEFKVTLAADALRPSDNDETLNAGTEISWNDVVFLRGGYKSLFGKDQEEGFGLGAGLKYKAEGIGQFEVNYAFNKFGLFGNLNTFSLAIGF
jgi:hypothetical protein